MGCGDGGGGPGTGGGDGGVVGEAIAVNSIASHRRYTCSAIYTDTSAIKYTRSRLLVGDSTLRPVLYFLYFTTCTLLLVL